MPGQLIDAPASTLGQTVTPLAYLEAYDAVLNDDYAFVAYHEKDVGTEAWRVRIKGRHTTGVVFEPDAMRLQARAAGAQGRPWFTWGNCMDPSAADPRSIQYRVHVRDSAPAEIEIAVQMRKADHTPAEPKTARFSWPAS